MEQIKANPLSTGAIDVMAQLFIYGPTWDGNIVSKSGRMKISAANTGRVLSPETRAKISAARRARHAAP